MIKILNYFIQSVFIYIFFVIGKMIGLNQSRKLFAFIFLKTGMIFKSKTIINNNLDNLSNKIDYYEKEEIIKNMWRNYGMTFIEYIYLDFFKKNNSHIKIEPGETLIIPTGIKRE